MVSSICQRIRNHTNTKHLMTRMKYRWCHWYYFVYVDFSRLERFWCRSLCLVSYFRSKYGVWQPVLQRPLLMWKHFLLSKHSTIWSDGPVCQAHFSSMRFLVLLGILQWKTFFFNETVLYVVDTTLLFFLLIPLGCLLRISFCLKLKTAH